MRHKPIAYSNDICGAAQGTEPSTPQGGAEIAGVRSYGGETPPRSTGDGPTPLSFGKGGSRMPKESGDAPKNNCGKDFLK